MHAGPRDTAYDGGLFVVDITLGEPSHDITSQCSYQSVPMTLICPL